MIISIILLCLCSFIIGFALAAYICLKLLATAFLRLMNIQEVAQNMLDGKYGEDGLLAALSFVLCESDTSLRKEKK